MTGFLCSARIYAYEGWTFEYHPTAVWPLKADGEPRKRAGAKFYDMLSRFLKEPDREKYRVGGGCQRF